MSRAEQHPNPEQSELSAAQKAIKEVADEIFLTEPKENDMNVVRYNVDVPAPEVEEQLRESCYADLLLKDGDSLSAKQPDKYWGDLGLYIGQATPTEVEVQSWCWDLDDNHQPIKPVGTKEPSLWGRQLDIRLWYSNGDQSA